jgi:hypothetical protein
VLENKCEELWFDGFLHLLEHLFNIGNDGPEPGQHPRRAKKGKCTERRLGELKRIISVIETREGAVPRAIY